MSKKTLLSFNVKNATVSLIQDGKPKLPASEKQETPDNKFYTVTPIKKRVTHDEFVTFVQNYPRKLTYDAFGACDPPLVTYNDFELANRWPFSVVASTRLYDEDPKGYFYESPDKRDYYIVTNYDELYASKTGYKAGENE